MVRALSKAEIPVVTPSAASIDVVKADIERTSVFTGHGGKTELVATFFRQGQTNKSTGIFGHEVDGFRCNKIGSDHETPSFSRSSVINQNDHAAGAQLVNNLLCGRNRHNGIPLESAILKETA